MELVRTIVGCAAVCVAACSATEPSTTTTEPSTTTTEPSTTTTEPSTTTTELTLEAFSAAYLDQYCNSGCTADLSKLCEPTSDTSSTATTSSDCDFDAEAAAACLDEESWTCEPLDDGGPTYPVPPSECASVCGPADPLAFMFPLEASRVWVLRSTVPDLGFDLYGEVERDESTGVHTVRYRQECLEADCVEGETHLALQMSTDDPLGVLIHGYETPEGTEILDPPMVLAPRSLTVGQTVRNADSAYQVEFVGEDGCGERLAVPTDWQCYQFAVTADEPDDPLHGTWSAVVGVGIVHFDLPAEAGPWRLLSSTVEE